METILILVQLVQVNNFLNQNTYLSTLINHGINNNLECACYVDGSLKADGSICSSTDPCPCDSNGACACGVGYIGNKCDECKSGYFDLDGNESNSITSCTGKSF